MRIKSFSYDMDMGGLALHEVAKLHQTFFIEKKYDWWYEILPDDVVVDIGAGTGMFAAKALDAGAKKVYMIEPNRRLLKTAIKNVSEYFMDTEEPKVLPINAAIGKTDIDCGNVYKSTTIVESDEDCKIMSFPEFVGKYDLDHIDYLKVDAEGAELNFLADHLDYISSHVRFAAINVHINAQYGAAEKFWNFRGQILKPFHDTNRLYFQDEKLREKVFANNWHEVLPQEFMVYIKNY